MTVAHEAPEVAVASTSEAVIEGEKAEFRCKASGIPTPTIAWERLGSDLPNGALVRNGLLTIPSAGPEDAGTYTCKAVNDEGEDSTNVLLEVIGKEMSQDLEQMPSSTLNGICVSSQPSENIFNTLYTLIITCY